MKKKFNFVFMLLFVLISFTLHAKEPLSYQQIVEFEGMTKTELYESVCQALAKIYSNSKFAIQYQDKDSGTIISNCHQKIKFNFMVMPTDFKMTINIKDGKIRITFSEIAITATVGKSSSTSYITNEKALNDFKKEGDKIIASIITEIKNKASDSDW